MPDIGNSYNLFVVFFAGIWPFLWILYEIRQIRKHMAKGRTIGGALIAEVGTLLGGPLIAVMALWIIFSVATPKLEEQGAKYAGQSQTGSILFGCLNNGGACLQANGNGQPAPTGVFYPTPTVGSQFFPTVTPNASNSTVMPPDPGTTSTPGGENFTPTPAIQPPTTTPTPAGAPDPTLFNRNPELAACVAGQLIVSNFANLTEDQIVSPATGYLPAGTSWTLFSPNFLGHTLTFDENESWPLCPDAYPGETNCYAVGGPVARALGGKVFVLDNRNQVAVVGTGQLPPACWSVANPTQ